MNFKPALSLGRYLLLVFLSALFGSRLATAQHAVLGQVEKVAEGFQFVEGPVWKDGLGLLFSDINGNTVYRWSPDSGATVFLRPSGKANGLTFDAQGRLLMAKQGDRQVTRLEANGTQTVLAATYDGKRLNSPNDLIVKSDSSIWFTDPPYGILPSPGELGFSGIYRLAPTGVLTLLDASLSRPNGIAFSPDEKKLFVADAEARRIYQWDIHDSTVSDRRQFAFMSPNGYADGMKFDSAGYLYATGPFGIWVYAPDGSFIDTVRVPGQTTNCGWGDTDRKTLYMTSGQAVYRIRPVITGIKRSQEEAPSHKLYIYPNPFRNSTVISWVLPGNGRARVRIVDVLGRVIMTPVDDIREMGRYETRVGTTGLSSGVYFCQVLSDFSMSTRKLFVIK